ncbi:hypothetical protein [Vibrio campbellii]|uniref:hypothetical protein n=1 Tax=Vibrio campbellii TaxID=680 RepID=UPI0038577F17
MKKTLCAISLTLAATAIPAQAIGIDQMIKFAQDGEAVFTITNNDGYRQYVNVLVADVDVKNGELTYTPYTRENIEKWSLQVQPPRAVIDNKMRKSFKATYTSPTLNEDYDKVYQLTFAPTPYFPEGEQPGQAVQVAIGFAPLLIVPAKKDQPLDFDMSYKSGKVNIVNNGGSYINVLMDTCPVTAVGEERGSCYKVVYVLKDRKLSVDLTEQMKAADKLRIEVRTHNGDFKQDFDLSNNEAVSEK